LTRYRELKKSGEEQQVDKEPLIVPGGKLASRDYMYLQQRGYKNPVDIALKWRLKATNGFYGALSFRIIIPIYFKGNLVSWTSRDTTGISETRYLSAPGNQEIIPHKQVLFGIDEAICYNRCIVVEGPFDAMRFGDGAVATFGTSWTIEQAVLLRDCFAEVFILYDNEELAQRQSEKLAATLSDFDIPTTCLSLKHLKDPAELSPSQIAKIKKDLLF
jgi:DNA primase